MERDQVINYFKKLSVEDFLSIMIEIFDRYPLNTEASKRIRTLWQVVSMNEERNIHESALKMLNQAAMESLYSATYVEDYLDSMENLPDDVIKLVTRMKELDLSFQGVRREMEATMEMMVVDVSDKRYQVRLQQLLMNAQDIGDEKLQVSQQIQDLVDNKARQLDLDRKNLDFGKETESQESYQSIRAGVGNESDRRRARRARHEVYVPSILGPTTLEATSFSEGPSASAEMNHGYGGSSSRSQGLSLGPSTSGFYASSRRRSTEREVSASLGSLGLPHKFIKRESSSSSGNGDKAYSAPMSFANVVVKKEPQEVSGPSTTVATTATPKKQQKATSEKRYKKRKTKQSESSPANITIDPDEPTYCLCDQVSYGEMIGCDNDLCPIEWFHFSCVTLTTKPKGKWYCPKCRGDRSNVMKPKALFLKELEKYNKEKEEKS